MKGIANGRQQNASAYLSTAPDALIRFHSYTGQGKEILGRLLINAKMDKAWMILASHINAQDKKHYAKNCPQNPYRILWGEIAVLLLRSRRLKKTWKAIDDDLVMIAKLAKDLRDGIISSDREDEGKHADRRRERDAAPKTGERFDHLPLEQFCPEIIKSINSQRVLIDGTDERRGDVAYWPRLSEVLDELLAKIKQERKKERELKRPVKRDKKTKSGESNRKERFFVVGLVQYLERDLRLARDDAIEVTASIASTIYNKKGIKAFVADAMRSN